MLRVGDANDIERIDNALAVFRRTQGRPTFIVLDSHIGYGSPHKQDTSEAHGEPLGEEEVKLTKRDYGWPEDAVSRAGRRLRSLCCRHRSARRAGPAGLGETFHSVSRPVSGRRRKLTRYSAENCRRVGIAISVVPGRSERSGWARGIRQDAERPRAEHPVVTRRLGRPRPVKQNRVNLRRRRQFPAGTPGGKNLHYGIREHAMGAVVNGLSLSKIRGYGSTFFIFSDYARPAIRLSALMELPTIFFTHDAMGDGEDGPTHQPVEHLASLRAIPGLVTIRPADANEVVEAYRYIMQLRHKPAILALSRQPLPTLDRTKYASAAGVAKECRARRRSRQNPEVILIASGSEVSLAVQAHEKLVAEEIRSRGFNAIVDIFEHQSKEYRDSVLPPGAKSALPSNSLDFWMGA